MVYGCEKLYFTEPTFLTEKRKAKDAKREFKRLQGRAALWLCLYLFYDFFVDILLVKWDVKPAQSLCSALRPWLIDSSGNTLVFC